MEQGVLCEPVNLNNRIINKIIDAFTLYQKTFLHNGLIIGWM